MHNLALAPTSFIGRSQEIDGIGTLLDDPACRLLTLVGPGGIGKSTLARRIATRLLDDRTRIEQDDLSREENQQ
ncbi:MAG: ATP-binding protein, partial [Chloroflexota bacterium]